MKKLLLNMAALMLAATAHAGIYRHDVSPEKYKKLAAQRQFDCVGMVTDKLGQNAVGSCVLIGSRYVLSAAHCFMVHDTRVDTFYVDKNGKSVPKKLEGGAMMAVNMPFNERPGNVEDYSFRFNGHRYHGKQLKIYQPYIDSVAKHNIFCGDVVLIELTESVSDITPATLNTAFDEKNVVITGVGYGASGPGNKPEDVGPYMEKIAGQNIVDMTEGYEVNGHSSLLSFDFDAPNRTDCNKMGSAKPLPLEWKPGGGDSGGGLFRQVKDQWQLVGIITGGSRSGLDMSQYMKTKGYYGGISQNLRVATFHTWIQQTITEFKKGGMTVDVKLK